MTRKRREKLAVKCYTQIMIMNNPTEPLAPNESISVQSPEQTIGSLSVDQLLEMPPEELKVLDDEQLSQAHHGLFDKSNELAQQATTNKLYTEIVRIRNDRIKDLLSIKLETDFSDWPEDQLQEKYNQLTAQLKTANQKALDALLEEPKNYPLFMDAKTEEAKIMSLGYWSIYGALMRLRTLSLQEEIQGFKEVVAEINELIQKILDYYQSVDSQTNIEAPADEKYETGDIIDADNNNLGKVEEMDFKQLKELAVRLNSDAVLGKIWPTESAMMIITALKKFRKQHKSSL